MKRSLDSSITLIAPPFSANPRPYISIPTLAAWLKKQHIRVNVLDLGQALIPRLITRNKISQGYTFICDEFIRLNKRNTLTPSETSYITKLQMLLRRVHSLYPQFQNGDFDYINVADNLLLEIISFSSWPEHLVASTGLDFVSGYDLYSSQSLVEAGDADFFFTASLKQLLKEQLHNKICDLIGISVVFDQHIIPAMQCARLIKELYPEVHITMGGPFVTIHLQQMENHRFFKNIDSLIYDEGEEPLVTLFEELHKKTTDYSSVPNLIWCDDTKKIVKNRPVKYIPLKDLPAPDYSSWHLPTHPQADDMVLSARLSKGCYWKKCAFCRVTLSLCKNYDQPAAEHAYNSLCHTIDQTGVRKYLFSDESCSPEILEEIAERLIADKKNISWLFHTRIDRKRLTRERVKKYKKAGCKEFTVGIETYNDRLLKLLNKGITEQEIDFVLNDLQGILPINAYMMLGLPSETEEEFTKSFATLKKFKAEGLLASYHYSLFYLSPGSLMWNRPERYGISFENLSDQGDLLPNNSTNFETTGMSRYEAVKHYFKWMHRKIPPKIHDTPIRISGENHFSRYSPERYAKSLGKHIIKQLDMNHVSWLKLIDDTCPSIDARDPKWLI